MGIEELGCPLFTHDDLDTRASEELFIIVKAGAIVKIAEHDQIVTILQMLLDPLAQPDALGKLLAPVLDRDAKGGVAFLGTMRRLGFCVNADQPDLAAAFGFQRNLERRLGPADQIRRGVDIKVEPEHAVKTRRARRALLAGAIANRVMPRRKRIGIVEQHDLLLRVVGKSDQNLAGADTGIGGKGLERDHAVAVRGHIRRFDDHDGIGIHRLKHPRQRQRLFGLGDVLSARPAVVVNQRPCIVEEVGEPFNVVGGDSHSALMRLSR